MAVSMPFGLSTHLFHGHRLERDHLARIAARDGTYHAFITVTANRALEDAARADAEIASGIDRGPLHGIPIGLKDLIDTAGIRTTSGSRRFEHHLPKTDAAVVQKLRDAGAVLIGKLMTYEFALVGPSFDLPFPASRNPWNADHITGGSIRSPACYCGVVGLKPTYERVFRGGVFPLSPSLDHVGPLSASVAEAAMTLDAISDANAASQVGTSIEGRRIAYARDWFVSDTETDSSVIAAMDDAVSQLSILGARIEEVTLPDYALYEAAGAAILQAEALAIHADALRDTPELYGRLAYQNLVTGLALSDTDVGLARRAAVELARRLQEDVFTTFDALVTANTLTPALSFAAFDGRNSVWTHMRTFPFNVTGNPVLAVPIGFSKGLPLGMQIVGKHLGEAGICAIGDAFERSTDHSAQRPPTAAERAVETV
jgi:aspartyl-tRNA(Asn)/glutamyl-tRNA(Gln) amidotransferase subunit A